MSPPINIDGSDIQRATIDGQAVSQITIDGQDAFNRIPDSGIARYTFDDADTSGDTALDLFNNNNATINGATTGVAGLAGTYDSGEAYSFDGVNDRVDTPVSPQSGGFSFGGWVSLDSQSSGTFSRAGDESNNQLVLRYKSTAARIEFYTFDGTFRGLRRSGVGLSNGVATHIIGAFDSTDGYTLYKNGSVAASDPSTTFIVPSATMVIGATAGGSDPIPADMDDWQYYAKGITDTEASNWYNTGNILGG